MKTILIICGSILLSPLACAAGELDRYLEKTTVAVAQFDVSRFDLPETTKFLQTELPEVFPPQAITGFQSIAGGILQSLRGAGVTKVYVTLSTLEITSGQLAVIVPTEKPAAVTEQLKAILAMLPASLGYQTHAAEGAVIVTTDAVWNRLATKPNADRRALIAKLDQAAGDSFSLTFNVRDDLRKSIADAWPERMPMGSPIELSPKAVMQDLISLQLALQSPPELKVRVSADCRDAQASGRIAELVNQQLNKLGVTQLKCTASESQTSASASGETLVALVRRAANLTRFEAANMQQSNNLKQIILGVHNFQSVHQSLPPRMTVSEKNTPLLSWRVFLLPYIDQQALYDSFHLDEPWDSPHNLTLVNRIPVAYQSLQFPDLKLGQTLVQMPLSPGSAWGGTANRMLTFQDITDGTSSTICFVFAPKDKAVTWTKPDDLNLGENLIQGLFGDRASCEYANFDGSVQVLPNTVEATELKAMLTHAGGEVRKR